MKSWINDILVNKNLSSYQQDQLHRSNYKNIKIDSRKLDQSSIFLPFQGQAINSHKFLPDISSKIKLFFYDKQGLSILSKKDLSMIDLSYGIEVSDTNLVLPNICKGICQDLIHKDSVKILALTGSVGKTTTRSMLSCLLKHLSPLVACGNLNNEIGVPLTVLGYTSGLNKCVILEFGARHLDDITYLGSMCQPDITSVINVRSSHLQEFSSVDNIYTAKSKIFDFGSTAITLKDDPKLVQKAIDSGKSTSFFGTLPDSDVRLMDQSLVYKNKIDPSLLHSHQDSDLPDFYTLVNIKIKDQIWPFYIPNYHSCYGINLAAALCMAMSLEPDIKVLQSNIFSFKNESSRFEIIKHDSFTIVNDCYNASLESMSEGLKSFYQIFNDDTKKVLVLGDMLELGESSESSHNTISELVIKYHPDTVITVGELIKVVDDKVNEYNQINSDKINLYHFNSIKEFDFDIFTKSSLEHSSLFVKASNSIGLNKVVSTLKTL